MFAHRGLHVLHMVLGLVIRIFQRKVYLVAPKSLFQSGSDYIAVVDKFDYIVLRQDVGAEIS